MQERRLRALRALLREKALDAVVISKYVNLHYFSGFRGDDTTLVVTAERALLVTDSRYTEQAAMEAPLFEVVEQKEGLLKKTAMVIEELGAKSVGFEGSVLSYDSYQALAGHLKGARLTTSLGLDKLREIKDAEEIACIRRACEIADAAFEDVLTFIRPGVTEIAVAARLEAKMRELGSEEPSFKTIVASGLRGSLPHGTATEKRIEEGDFVTMDFGAMYRGYCSDITRTVMVGKASERQREVYAAVLSAQKKGLSLIKPGASGKAIDAAVREELDKYGLNKYFGHGLGHSLGLEIHEEPRLSRASKCEALQPGMLITDEPGVYIPSWGGLRIEDTVLVTEEASEPLTKCSKELIEII